MSNFLGSLVIDIQTPSKVQFFGQSMDVHTGAHYYRINTWCLRQQGNFNNMGLEGTLCFPRSGYLLSPTISLLSRQEILITATPTFRLSLATKNSTGAKLSPVNTRSFGECLLLVVKLVEDTMDLDPQQGYDSTWVSN